MKLAFALISALILMDYAVAELWKQSLSYTPKKTSPEQGYEQVQEAEGYLEAHQKQNIQSNPENNHELQQQKKQRKIYYPTAVMGDKKQSPAAYYVNVDPQMTTGAVEVVFKTPTSGSNNLYIFNARNDILLRVWPRFNDQVLTLNSRLADGDYGENIRPEGFPFPCCEYVTIITLRVDIAPKAFIISANGLELANYPFRSELGPPVDIIRFDVYSTGAELISMMLEY